METIQECVLEHIGLGRYGDPLDPRGTDKAIAELCRVLSPGGDLYVSVPVEQSAQVYFNAHRVFNPNEFAGQFAGLDLIEMGFAQKDGIKTGNQLDLSRAQAELTIGLFHMRRPASSHAGAS